MLWLDEVEQFAENQEASVASLRRCSPSDRNSVRLPSGMLFSFVGIPKQDQPLEPLLLGPAAPLIVPSDLGLPSAPNRPRFLNVGMASAPPRGYALIA